jgi:hypothetical protein
MKKVLFYLFATNVFIIPNWALWFILGILISSLPSWMSGGYDDPNVPVLITFAISGLVSLVWNTLIRKS